MGYRGKPSTAHRYDKIGACIICGMYKVNVDAMSHACKPLQEAIQNKADEEQAKSLVTKGGK